MNLKCVAIVGLGSIGRRHLRLLHDLRPDLSIILIRSGRGGDYPEAVLGSRIVSTIDDAIEAGVQAAIIATPASLHFQQSMRFIESGVHFLVEKPLALSTEGIQMLIDSASRNSVISLVGYVLRYDPAARCFKKWLQKHIIGKIIHVSIICGSFLPDWRPQQDYRKTVSSIAELGGGVLFELSHELDYLHWFFGKPIDVQAKLAKSGTLDIDVEDSSDLIITCSGNVTLSVHLDFNRRIPTRACIVQTTEGELRWNALAKEVVWHSAGQSPELETFEYDHDHMYRSQLEHFLACIEKGVSPIVSLDDGAAVMYLIEAAQQAHKTGCKVLLP